MQVDYFMKQNDTLPRVRATLLEGKNPSDLGTATEVRLFARSLATNELKINRLCTVIDALTGLIEFDWEDGDTGTPGFYSIEIQVTRPTGKTTYPNDKYSVLQILPELN